MPPDYSNGQSNPYDFIVNPAPKPKRSLFRLPMHDPFIRKIVLIAGGAISILIVLIVVVAVLGGGKSSTDTLLGLAQTEQELTRIATAGATGGVQQNTKNMATTTQVTIQSHQQQVLALLNKRGLKKVSTKQLSLKQDASTDQQLTVARQTSTFDLVFSQIMQRQLQSYATTVKQLATTSAKASEQELFSDFYEQTQLLISQITPAQSQ
jgi:hypothetical protein